MIKRILSLLLAFLMMVSYFPTPSHAADTDPTDGTTAPVCAVCGKEDCTKEHKTCSKCGTVDCTADHSNWCGICKKDNCGKEHKACGKCGTVDCTADHSNWCGICKADNCGKEHKTCGKCGTVDCTADHSNWCDVCRKDNCGEAHNATEAPSPTESPAPTETSAPTESKNLCGICGTENCSKEHKTCDKCGTMDCTADHSNWCGICKTDNCGKTHVWCDTCQKHDCGIDHSTAATEQETQPQQTPGETEDNCPYCEDTLAEDGSVVHAKNCTAAYAYDGSADVGKYAKFVEAIGAFEVCDGSNFDDSMIFYYDDFTGGTVVRITDWYWDAETTGLWYAVSFCSGGVTDASAEHWPETPWVLHDYTDTTYAFDATFAFVSVCSVCQKPGCTTEHIKCEICGKYDCKTEHIKCEICGKYDCKTVHIYCEVCDKYGCGKDHLFCLACEMYDCALTHTFCGYCNAYDCGIDHRGENKPAVTPVIPASPTLAPGNAVSIVDEDGDPVSGGLRLTAGMRTSLSAWSNMENPSYRWQIRYDNAGDLWADIQGQTGKGILASPAMFLSVIEKQGSAAIRCVMTSGEETRISDSIPVSIAKTDSGMPLTLASRAASLSSRVKPLADAEGPGELEKAYIVIQYQYSDGRTAAASDFAQTIPGAAYSHAYDLPSIPGYKATLKTHPYGNNAKIEGNDLVLDFAENILTETYSIFTIVYVPDFVSVTVIHYWQNPDNDNYSEHERETVSARYKTGEQITDAHNNYPGFYNLLYESPTAAADGSTVIEVYYDRYYYLMKFDLGDMGYGVDPIYARSGAEIEIGTPTRAGYTFLGWMLNGEDASVPTAMPAENRTYTAKWQASDKAKVTIVFWGENPDDEGYSYVNSGTLETQTGTEYTFRDGTQVLQVCGKEEHIHDDCNLICGKAEHISHTADCLGCGHCTLDCYKAGNSRLITATKPSQVGSATQDGIYTYTTGTLWKQTHYYLCLNGIWYRAQSGDTQKIENVCNHTHSDNCYECDYHAHIPACYSCGMDEHTHNNSCNQTGSGMDSNLWTFIRSETVTVKPDGTTVVNVYYDRKTFTMHFRKSGSDSDDYGAITDKWGANIEDEFEAVCDRAGGQSWSEKKQAGFPLTNHLVIMPQTNKTYYHYTGSGNKLWVMTYYRESLAGGEYEVAFTVELRRSNTTYVSEEEYIELEGFIINHDLSSDIEDPTDGAQFYYDRHRYAIEFYNPTVLLKTATGIPFESNLGSYDFIPTSADVPTIYEPGSVMFAGWYLNPECTGDQYILADHTIPSAPKDGDTALVLYAKWAPVTYKVNYYMTRESLNRGENIPAEMARLVDEAVAAGITRPANNPYADVFAEDSILHGEYIEDLVPPGVSEGYKSIHPRAGYEFVGWFYLNADGEEIAFDPENMPVNQDLNLYAKWSANKLCKYNIYFALDEDADGEPDKDTSGNTIYVAAPVTGSGIAGRTYTFTAKGSEELYEAYRDGYFPTVGSHSLIIDIADEQGTAANSYTFLYQEKQAVPYTVRYVDKDTGESLLADKVVSNNRNIVVTENFQYIQGYMPDAYQKTLVVEANSENVITFYYTKDESHALYVVNYYIQELDEDLNHKGWTKYTDLQSTGNIGEYYSASTIDIDGFTLSPLHTDDFNTNKKINGATGLALPSPVSNLIAAENAIQISGQLSDKGLELNFYYTRNLYPFEFRYMLNGTTTELADPVVGKGGYDTIVTEVAKEIVMDLDGDGVNEDYRLYDPTETSKDIHIVRDGAPLTADAVVEKGDATVNIATFYYVRCTQTMTVTKHVIDNSSESDPDPDQEFTFSLLIHAKNGYHRNSYPFRKSDGTEGILSPEISAPNTLQFTLKADQTITIEGLPTAEYTLTELNLPAQYHDHYNTTQENGRYKLTVDSAVNAVVTNIYEPTKLTITKTVDVVEENTNTPEVKYFVFSVAVPEGVTGSYDYTVGSTSATATVANGQMSVTLQNGQTATFHNLPVGSYTVTETDYTSYGYDSNYTVNGSELTEGNSVQVNLTGEKTQAIAFINKFPVEDLTIEKTVSKEFFGSEWSGDTFTFTLERTTYNRPLIKGNQYPVLIDGVEQAAKAVVAENGTLTLEIAFSDADAEILSAAGTSVTHSLVIKNLPAGTYSVTEAADDAYTQNPTNLTVSNLYIPREEVTASFTNTLKRGTGDLYLEKIMEVLTGYHPPEESVKFGFTVELLEGVPANQTYTVEYVPERYTDGSYGGTYVAMDSGVFTVALEKDQNVTIHGLPEGTYRITETTVPYYANAFAHKKNGDWVVQPTTATPSGQMYTDIRVEPAATAEVQCTNTYPVNRAELIIQKFVTKAYERDTLPDDDFTFTVTLDEEDADSYSYQIYDAEKNPVGGTRTAAVTDRSFTVTLKAGQYAVIPGMPVCGYTVSEDADTANYDVSYEVYLSETGDEPSAEVNTGEAAVDSGDTASVSRTFSAGKTDAAVFTNEYKRHLGTLTIEKTATGSAEQDTFLFHIEGTGENNSHIRMDVNITGSGHVTVYDLPLGSYTVTENMDWSWRYTNTNPVLTADLTVDPDGQVAFTNALSKKLWLNDYSDMPNIFGRKNNDKEGS